MDSNVVFVIVNYTYLTYVVYALVESTEIFKTFEIPKIYFRNPVFNLLSENFTFRKFPPIR